MPIVAEHSKSKQRHAALWMAAFLAFMSLPVGVFAWSCFDYVAIPLGNQGIWFGRSPYPSDEVNWVFDPDRWLISIPLGPLGTYNAGSGELDG